MTPQEVKAAADSLRTVGGVYEYVADCVEYDNRPADPPLTETDLDALARMGLPRTSLDLPKENTTMTDRTDHTAEARSLIAWGEDFEAEAGRPDASQVSSAVHSLTHATLALVEQQRIANLIALAGLRDVAGFENEIYDARLEALMAGLLDRREAPAVTGYGPAGIDEQTFIRPEISAALGINPEGDTR